MLLCSVKSQPKKFEDIAPIQHHFDSKPHHTSLQGYRRTHMHLHALVHQPQNAAVNHGHVSTELSRPDTLGESWERGRPTLHCNSAPETKTHQKTMGVLPSMAKRLWCMSFCPSSTSPVIENTRAGNTLRQNTTQGPWHSKTVEAVTHVCVGNRDGELVPLPITDPTSTPSGKETSIRPKPAEAKRRQKVGVRTSRVQHQTQPPAGFANKNIPTCSSGERVAASVPRDCTSRTKDWHKVDSS